VRIDSHDVVVGHFYGEVDGVKKKFRVVTRPKEVKVGDRRIDGDACIRFTIEPMAMFGEIGFRIDRSYDRTLGKYVVVIDIEGRYLKQIGNYHHSLPIQLYIRVLLMKRHFPTL
jgi:hypothetical protein